MNRYVRVVRTSIGCKAVMAVTGLLLLGFVISHMLGNLQVYRGADKFNEYAEFMQSLGPWLWLARLGLLAIFVVHLAAGLRLTQQNHAARPNRYVYETLVQEDPLQQTRVRAATYMWLSGLVILFFLLYHLAHFTLGWINTGYSLPIAGAEAVNVEDASPQMRSRLEAQLDVPLKDVHFDTLYLLQEPGEEERLLGPQGRVLDRKGRPDVYGMFIAGFRNPLVAGLYVISMLVLGAHLAHGVGSMFQTVGVNHPALNCGVRCLAAGVAALIVLGNCVMPLSILFGIYPGN